MKALTIWQPWASLIMAGAKPYEFRRWAAPRALVGTRIAIHAGARPVRHDEVMDLLFRLRYRAGEGTALLADTALPILERVMIAPKSLPLASVLGTARLGAPVRAAAQFAGAADADRIDPQIWAWPLGAVEVLEPFVPCRGAQGFWDWTPPA